MSKKYIAQINNTNFVFPNYKLAEYDVEIIHELKENSVSGTTSGFDMSYSSGNISISFTYQWYLNSAEPFISNDGKLNILSLHIMTNDKKYFKPWICVGLIQDNNTSLTYKTDTQNFVVTPQMVGQTSFTNGTYFAEIRMMGHRAVFPINYSDTVSGITVTPTPTPTVTPTNTPTPTPTPTPTTPPAYNYYTFTPCLGGAGTDYRSITSLALNDIYAFQASPPPRACYEITSITASVNSNDLPTIYGPKTDCNDGDCTQP
jgi:hypothetical protein